jgi:cysteinyl-tRNA synthetase
VTQALIEKGYAYVSGGNVYFDTSKTPEYYVFHGFREEDLEVGVREGVEADQNKRHQADFALWFTKSKFDSQELKWDSPWGVGYPGWHIECSCISMKYAGEYLDIHCGGIDNAFPHHTNEIAQSEAYLGHKWCSYWMHVLHLNTTSGKMSKSKGEFLTVSLLESKGYDPLAYRFFCLQSHYRKGLVFSYENLDNAAIAYKKLMARVASLSPKAGESIDEEGAAPLRAAFVAALYNDLNTSLAVTAVYDVLKSQVNDTTKLALLKEFDTVLAIGIGDEKAPQEEKEEVLDPRHDYIMEQIALRKEAKKNKNYAEADRIRAALAAEGITLIDTPQGTTYKIGE